MKKTVAVLTSLSFIFSILAGNAHAVVYERAFQPASKIESFSEPAIAGHAGKITEGMLFAGKQLVVNIQDLHCNGEVQRNIAGTLADIDKKYAIANVYAEGAYSDISTGWICDIENETAKTEILEALLDSGRLTGSEYYSAMSNQPDLIKGIENKKIHQANIVRLGNIIDKQNSYDAEIKKLDKELSLIQAKYFNFQNNRFNRFLSDYGAGKTDIKKYYTRLVKYINEINRNSDENNLIYYINFSDYPNVLRHIELIDTARNLSYGKVTSQMVAFMREIKEKMPYSVYVELSVKTNKFSNLHDMYIYVPELVKNYDIQFAQGYSELQKFFEYTKKEKELNPVALLHEEKRLIEKIRIGLSQDIDELEVSFLSDCYTYFKDYLSASITPDDYQYFTGKIDEFEKVWNKYVYGSAMNDLSADFSGINEYYAANFQRDIIFKDKLNLKGIETDHAGTDIFSLSQQKIKEILSKAEITVVITGGFHSEGLKNRLKSDKISYITFTPNISSKHDSSALYNDLVKIQSKLFAGQALALPLGSADAKITFDGNSAFVDFNGEKLELYINEKSRKYEIRGSLSGVKSLKPYIFTQEIQNQIISNIESIRRLSSPLESSLLIYTIVEEASRAGVERGFISGNGLIWAIAGNDAVINAIKESKKGIALNEVAMLPDLMQMYVAGSSISEMKIKFVKNPILQALIDVPEFGSFIKNAATGKIDDVKLNKYDFNAGKFIVEIAQRILSKIYTFVLVFTLSGAILSANNIYVNTQNMPELQKKEISAKGNTQIRKIANEFMRQSFLPKSFIASSDIISDPDQKLIVEQGVIVYDMAVLLKALLLYPQENQDLISKMVNALAEESNMRSNHDFDYGNAAVNNKGYFWKIIDVDAKWLHNQSLPITGENAWIAAVMANVYETYKETPLGDTASKLLQELSEAMLSLQLDNGLIRMAPRDKASDYSYTINYHDIVSVENNISVLPVFRYMAEKGPQQSRAKFKAAYDKLESGLIGMYNIEEGYFNAGLDISINKINRTFATDCQTWMVLAMGPEKFDRLMKAEYGIDNASLKLLKKTLEVSGVKKNGTYAGLDFTSRKSIVSFEWTLGFVAAAKKVLVQTYDSDLQKDVSSIMLYINSQMDANGILNYTDSPEPVETGFGWTGIVGKSLASSAWGVFGDVDLPTVSPFDYMVLSKDGNVIDLFSGVKTGIRQMPISAQAQQSHRKKAAEPAKVAETAKVSEPASTVKVENIIAQITGSNYYGGSNWVNFTVMQNQGVKISVGDKITLSYDSQSQYNTDNNLNFLLRVVTDKGSVFLSNSDEIINKADFEILKMNKTDGAFEASVAISGIIEEIACDFGQTSIFFTSNNRIETLNTSNDGNPRFKSVMIAPAQMTMNSTVNNYLKRKPNGIVSRLYNNNATKHLAIALIALSPSKFGAVRSELALMSAAAVNKLKGNDTGFLEFVNAHPEEDRKSVEKSFEKIIKSVKFLVPVKGEVGGIRLSAINAIIAIRHWFTNLSASLPVSSRTGHIAKESDVQIDNLAESMDTQRKQLPTKTKSGFMRKALTALFSLFALTTLIFTVSCSKDDDIDIVIPQEKDKDNEYLRKMVNSFFAANKLPRSFIGSSGHLPGTQKLIADNGVIIYDLAVILKTLLLYPNENRDLIDRIVTALDNGRNVRSNSDFAYGSSNIGAGEGYFWKIISKDATWLQDQSLPITGENAWLANAMIGIYEAYGETSATGKTAYKIFTQLAESMYALQTHQGFVRMAPIDLAGNYVSAGIDYNTTISTENNISVLPIFRYMAENGSAASRTKYQKAYDKLESALMGAYSNAGYFDTGFDMYTGEKNKYFATDCQTWMILAFGPQKLNKLMSEKNGVSNASITLLKKTLSMAGVRKNNKYVGVDFTERGTVVSFEWTAGFIIAAKQALALNSDAELQNAIDEMTEYMKANTDSNGVIKYIDSDTPQSTGFDWIAISGMGSLTSSGWGFYINLGLYSSPFDNVALKRSAYDASGDFASTASVAKSSPVKQILPTVSKAVKSVFVLIAALSMFACTPDFFEDRQTSLSKDVYNNGLEDFGEILNDPEIIAKMDYYKFPKDFAVANPYMVYRWYLNTNVSANDKIAEVIGLPDYTNNDADYYNAYLEYKKLPGRDKSAAKVKTADMHEYIEVMKEVSGGFAKEEDMRGIIKEENSLQEAESRYRSKTAAKEVFHSNNQIIMLTKVRLNNILIVPDTVAGSDKMVYNVELNGNLAEYLGIRGAEDEREIYLNFNVGLEDTRRFVVIDFNRTDSSAIQNNIIRHEIKSGTKQQIRIPVGELSFNYEDNFNFKLSVTDETGAILNAGAFRTEDLELFIDLVDSREELSYVTTLKKGFLTVDKVPVNVSNDESGEYVLKMGLSKINKNTAICDLILKLFTDKQYKDAVITLELKNENSEFDGNTNIIKHTLDFEQEQRLSIPFEALKEFTAKDKIKIKINIEALEENTIIVMDKFSIEMRTYEIEAPQTAAMGTGENIITASSIGLMALLIGGWKKFRTYMSNADLKTTAAATRDIILLPFVEESLFRWAPLVLAAVTGLNPVLLLAASGVLFVYAHNNTGFVAYRSSLQETHTAPVSNTKELIDLGASTMLFSLLAMIPSVGPLLNLAGFSAPLLATTFPTFAVAAHVLTNFFVLSYAYDIYRKPIVKFSAFSNPFVSQRNKIAKILPGFNADSEIADKGETRAKILIQFRHIFSAARQYLSHIFISFIVFVATVACSAQNKTDKDASSKAKIENMLFQERATANEYIRQTAKEFMQGNPLPRSFIGETSHIDNPYQKMIAEKGVIVYDMAVLMKALLLYPEENKDLLGTMVRGLALGNEVRSNKDFDYQGANIETDRGYFWKILDVNGAWLQDQSQPITGENAWIANAMAGVHEAYKGTTVGDYAYSVLNDISRAMLTLQLDNGLIRMAPKDNVGNYSYADVDYNNTVSVENNLSCLPVFRYMSVYGEENERAKYKEALNKLELALIGMYNQEKGYFNTGLEVSSNKINSNFATDCQTWMILAFGAKKFDSAMKEKYGITTASVNLLKQVLENAGVKENGKYIGTDFSARSTIVSFEWTLGFLSAAKQALNETADRSLQEAVDSMEEYMNASRDKNGLLPYANTEQFEKTEHGWIITPGMFSLASTSWGIFEVLGIKTVSPFDLYVLKNGALVELYSAKAVSVLETVTVLVSEAKQETIEAVQADEEVLQAAIRGSDYYGGGNWVNFSIKKDIDETVKPGDKLVIGFDTSSEYHNSSKLNTLIRVVTDKGTYYFSNSDKIVKDMPGTIKMKIVDGTLEGVFDKGGKIREIAGDFGEETSHYHGYLNTNNDGNPRFNSVRIVKGGAKTSEQLPEQAPEQMKLIVDARITGSNYHGGGNWANFSIKEDIGETVKPGDKLVIGFDTSSEYHNSSKLNTLIRVVTDKGTYYFSNSDKIVKDMPGTIKMKIADGMLEGVFDKGGKIREIAGDFGEETSHYHGYLNTDNDGNPRFNSIKIYAMTTEETLNRYLEKHSIIKRLYDNEKTRWLAVAAASLSFSKLGAVRAEADMMLIAVLLKTAGVNSAMEKFINSHPEAARESIAKRTGKIVRVVSRLMPASGVAAGDRMLLIKAVVAAMHWSNNFFAAISALTANILAGNISSNKIKRTEKIQIIYQHVSEENNLQKAIEAFGAAITDNDGNAYTNIYFMEMPANPDVLGLQNMGWSVDKEQVWGSLYNNVLIVFSKAAQEDVIKEFDRIISQNGKVNASSLTLKRIKSIAKDINATGHFDNLVPGIIIDHNEAENPGRYNENGSMVVSADIIGNDEVSISENLSYIAQTRKVDANAMAKETYIFIDGTSIDMFKSYLGAFVSMGNNQMMVDFEVFKNLSDKQIIEILTLAKENGINISVAVSNDDLNRLSKNYFRELGFAGYVTSIGNKLYMNDYFSSKKSEMAMIKNYKNEDELVDMIRKSGKLTVVRMSEFENFVTNKTRSVVDKVSVIETFRTAILKLRSGKILTPEYARNAGLSWDNNTLPALPENMSALVNAVKKSDIAAMIKELGQDLHNNAISLYISQMANNVKDEAKLKEIQAAFLIAIIEKAIAAKTLKDNGINDGLANLEFEIILGNKLLRQLAENTMSSGIPDGIRDFIDSEKGTLNDLNNMIMLESSRSGPQAVNATIELILLSEQKTAAIRVSKTMSFDAKAVDALLRAA